MTTPKTEALPWREMSVRDRDCVIGKRVMGWSQGNFKTNHWWYNGVAVANSRWSPTVNVRDAHAVIEEMRRNGFRYRIEDEGNNSIRCQFFQSYEMRRGIIDCRGVASTNSFPEAVCLSALLAVGIEVAV